VRRNSITVLDTHDGILYFPGLSKACCPETKIRELITTINARKRRTRPAALLRAVC